MGGVAKNIGTTITSAVTNPGGYIKNAISHPQSLVAMGAFSPYKGGGGPQFPGAPNQANPLTILEQTGGAVLLANIASGADPDTALAAYLGVNPAQLSTYIGQLDEADKAAINGIQVQLNQINNNTNLKNQAIQKLVNDYPNIMANSIQKYGAQADAAIKPMLDQAMASINAKYSAGGMLSSGASAAAAARAGTEAGYQRLGYATNLADRDFMNQLSEAEALRGFQQKMLGQGATQGFQRAGDLLGFSAKGQEAQYETQVGQAKSAQEAGAAFGGVLGKVGGGIIGGAFGGPSGAAAGSTIGGAVGTYAGSGQLS